MPNKPKKVKPLDHPTNRPKPDQSHYNYRHQQFRKMRIQLHPLCERCNDAFSWIAHHLVYPALTIEDYRAVCEKCHIEDPNWMRKEQ